MNLKRIMRGALSSLSHRLYHIEIDQLINETAWIPTIQKKYTNIIKIFPMYPMRVFLEGVSKPLVKELDSNMMLRNQVRKNWLGFFQNQDDDIKAFMSRMFFYTDMIDESVMKEIVKFLKKTTIKEYRYWLALDIDKMVFFQPNCLYSNYYNDRKKVLELIAKENAVIIPTRNKNVSSENKLKLCIVTYLLSPNVSNSMQRVAMMMASGLKRNAVDVMVVCLDSFTKSVSDARMINSMMNYTSSTHHKKEIARLFPNGTIINYSKGKDYKSRLQDAIRIIYNYSPDIIVDIADEYSPLSFYYSLDFFTAYFPMRGDATSQFYSAIAGVPFKYENTNRLFNNCIDMSKVIEWSFPEYVPPEHGTITKQDIGLQDEQFCIISIGNNSCFSQDFIDEVCSIVKKNEKIVWLLVGNNAPDYLHTHYEDLLSNGKIIEWGYEKNLAGICRACDVHLRYNLTGGSGGTAIAAMQGLPIVMTNYVCDASRWLGLDYSSIDNFHDLALEIQRLYEDSEYYEQRKTVTLELVGKAVDSKEKWNDLYNKLIEAYERWKAEGHV